MLANTPRNHVGYAGSQLRESGNTLTSVQFMDIASPTGSIKLSSIVPIKSNGEVAGWWEVEIQYLKYDGRTDEDHDYMWNGANWENLNMEDMSNVDIPAGQGLWVANSTGVAVTFQSSGEVNQSDVIFELRDSGNTAAANCFPTLTKLGEVLPSIKGSSDLPGWWEVEIQYLKYDGRTDDDNDYMWNGANWENLNMEDMSNVDVPAGQGLWVANSTGKTVLLRIPAPELTK